MTRQTTWWMMAGVVVAVFFRPAPALAAPAPLVALMERCTPPIGGIDDASKGYGNYASDPSGKSGNWTRSVKVRFAWAYDDGAETKQEAINATHRLDVCEIFRALPTATDPGGEAQVYCPGWHGHSAWVSGAPAAKYVSTLAEATVAGGTASESSITVPYDWDLLYANGPVLFVLVVNADHEPTFNEIKNENTIPTSGFCGAPTRIASKLDYQPPQNAPAAIPSLPGQ